MNDFKMKELAEAKNTLVTAFKSQLSNIESASTEELGQVADIIKDLAAAEKYCYESCYYKTVIEAMEDGDDPKYGYSPMKGNYRMSGSGRMGYKPYMDQEPYINGYLNDPNFDERMGYNNRRLSNGRYGYVQPETIDSAMDGVKDIWDSADMDKKKRLKKELMAMINEMDG